VKDANGEPTGVLKNAQALIKGLNRSEHFSEAEKLMLWSNSEALR